MVKNADVTLGALVRTPLAITWSKSTIETQEQGLKSSKLTTNTPERRHWRRNSHLVLVLLLLTLSL